MAGSIICASCGTTQPGGSLHCIRCAQLLRPALTALPANTPAPPAPPILDALPADEAEMPLQATVLDDEPAETDPPLSEPARKLTMSHRLAPLNPSQRVVYALLVRTLEECRSDRITLVLGFLFVPLLFGFGLGFSVLVMWGLIWLVN